tara:strand:+ start:77 stop:622 length:546 start_codon:yes stop_codon:yes gene_type:complete
MEKNKELIISVVVGVVLLGGLAGIMIKNSGGKTKKEGGSVVPTEEGQEKTSGFLGEKGEMVEAEEGVISIEETSVGDGNLHAFNFYSKKEGKTIYFLVIKAGDGSYRVAANACEVCFGSKLGFRQVGDIIRCENCRTTYEKDQVAMEKGGCNPRPIDKDAKVLGGQLLINVVDVETSADLF